MILSKPIYNTKKEELINTLYNKGITDKNILEAIFTLPRELFIPAMFQNLAYEDRAVPILDNQTISQPYTVAFQTMLLNIQKGDKVLEIGTGSGYQASVLHLMGAEVYTIERIENLYNFANSMFEKLEIQVNSYLGDGTIGLEEFQPFDKIIVTAAAPKIPVNLVTQLKINGLLVIPVGDLEFQKMSLVIRTSQDNYTEQYYGDFKFVPLIGQDGWQ
ncbi:MAG: protein-L-isoaspartate(D-aspartate) O-methyltransferase [Candidatus Kapaibacteriota bacterium]